MASAPEQRAAHDAELAAPRDTTYWAKPVGRLDIAQVPTGAISLNVIGRRVAGPVQGFGQLWQKTYRVRLEGCAATPAEVVQAWKERLPRYQPTANRFFPPVAGVAPGEVVLINAVVQGMPALTGVWTHVLVSLAADFDVQGRVTLQKTCVDPRRQLSEAKNVWQNALIRSIVYTLLLPLRRRTPAPRP